MIVVRKLIGFVVYAIIFFFGTLFIGGAIVGGMAGAEHAGDMAAAQEAGRIAGEEFGMVYGTYILLSALAIAGLGSIFGILPFTRHRKKN